MINIRFFYLQIFLFLVAKFSIYMNRRVFVMLFSDLFSYFMFSYSSVDIAVTFNSCSLCFLFLFAFLFFVPIMDTI